MNIVFGDEHIQNLNEKYLILELDTFKVNESVVPTYCIIDSSSISIDSLTDETSSQLHSELIENYKKGDLKFCKDAIKNLYGKFNGELDSFYDIFSSRLDKISFDDEWCSTIDVSDKHLML